MNNIDTLNKYKKLVSEQETKMIRTDEQIKSLEKEIKNLSGEIKNKFGCEPNAKAMKAELLRLQNEIDADFQKLTEIFDTGENEDDADQEEDI